MRLRARASLRTRRMPPGRAGRHAPPAREGRRRRARRKLSSLSLISTASYILKPFGLFDDLRGRVCRLGRSLLLDGRFSCEAGPHPQQRLARAGDHRRLRSAGSSGQRYSADGRCRCRFVAARCSLAARRRRLEPRVGLVARRRAASGARPSARRSASLARAISRLRSWERRSEAVTVITPAVIRRPRRVSSISRWPSERAVESLTFQESSTRLSEVLTCCPPGPDERENRQTSSDEGIVSAGETSRSMHTSLAQFGRDRGFHPLARYVPGRLILARTLFCLQPNVDKPVVL